jgi:hypothetical protein
VHRVLSTRLAIDDEASAEALVNHFLLITPPEVAPAVAPGHVELNLKTLVTATQQGTITFPGAAVPWTMLLGALLVWEQLWLTEPLDPTEIDAAVLWALWKTRDSRDMVGKSTIVTAVNTELTARGQTPMTPAQIEVALTKLRHLKCIETARSAVNSFWLRECVQLQYP